MKNVLSIAGSDPSGGAGIQADLKTMCAMGVYGMTVIVAVTVQNTQAVYAVRDMEPDIVRGQIEAVFDDIEVHAVKVGMMSDAKIIRTVRDGLLKYRAKNIVVDPVMVSKSGYPLLKPESVSALRELIGIADVLTPNLPEAQMLCGFPVETEADMRRAAETLARMGAKNVLVKGGHRAGSEVGDLLLTRDGFTMLAAERIETRNTHGTGCTLSSAVASRLALGDDPARAARAAKAYVTQAIRDAYAVGKGVGPVGHMDALHRRAGTRAAEAKAEAEEMKRVLREAGTEARNRKDE